MGKVKTKKKRWIRLMNKETGTFYVKKSCIKNAVPVKLSLMKYDPKIRKHVLFNEEKMK